ncbi:alkene reductase [Paracoccus aerodenitrificans]|uniref:alkene reductase n=1 Tax=Paracoccus aerodenitrificans TaxID=3017781 RepID=UPI0022EFF1F7|nr:alkene reductase [Paracoccus aerodenitrificans]WBU63505.1 alkene reductase [Paracoccus aerodenitrificans]
MSNALLFEPYQLGDLTLSNRVVMAPLTRNRAADGLVPGPNAAEYYAQRASAGLIIAEATQVSEQAQGYQDTPGIYSDAQVAGWRKVTDAVHEKGGKIFVQLWHTGRISHVSVQPGNRAPVAPSAVAADAKTFVDGGFQQVSEPRALELSEIPDVIDSFRSAAANAIRAGFDGVEIHAANGYLIDQFSKDGANKRDDDYGGSIQNRARFLLEVMQAVIGEIGPNRTGIRISPVTPANGISDSDPQKLFDYIVAELDKLSPVYLHVIEGATGGPRDVAPFDYAALRKLFRSTYIANNGYDRELADKALADGAADLISFGAPYVANPDLVARLEAGAALAVPDRDTLYGGGAKGYTDYPTMSGTV